MTLARPLDQCAPLGGFRCADAQRNPCGLATEGSRPLFGVGRPDDPDTFHSCTQTDLVVRFDPTAAGALRYRDIACRVRL